MQHTILELEEAWLGVCVADVDRRGIAVRTCRRLPLGSGGDGLLAALQQLQRELPAALAQVHVLLGDRRCQHFTLTVPRLPQPELRALVVREALRSAGLADGTEVLARARPIETARGRLLLGVTAVAAAVVEPLLRACCGLGIDIASLATVEDGLGLAIDFSLPPRTAVVEFSFGRARFVVCARGVPVQVRRFLVSGFEQGDAIDPAVLGAQLAMEVPRTLDYLREQGQARPEALLLSRRLGLGEDDLEVFAEQGMRCLLARADWRLDDGQQQPGLAAIGRLRALQRGKGLTSLLDGVRVRLPLPRARLGAAAALLLLGSLGSGLLLAQRGVVDGLQLELEAATAEAARVERQLGAAAPAARSELLQRALARRRPHSLLLAGICNAAPAACELQRIEFDADGATVSGRAAAPSRRQALAALSGFAGAIEQLRCVQSRGRDDIGELGPPGQLRFSFALQWRRP